KADSKSKAAWPDFESILATFVATTVDREETVLARVRIVVFVALNRFVLKSIISTSTPSPFAAGVISSLSIVPVRIPSGRRRRKRNSLQRPGLDFGLGTTDCGFGIWDLESAKACTL